MIQSLQRSKPAESPSKTPDRSATAHPFEPAPAVIFSHQLLDTLMPACDPYEWKIVCAVLRHQDEQKQSVGKFMRWTGMQHRKTCFDTLVRCLEKGYIVRVPSGNSFSYRPNPELELPGPDRGRT